MKAGDVTIDHPGPDGPLIVVFLRDDSRSDFTTGFAASRDDPARLKAAIETPPKQKQPATKNRNLEKPNRETWCLIMWVERSTGVGASVVPAGRAYRDVVASKLGAVHHDAAAADFAATNEFALLLHDHCSANRTN